MVDCPRKEGEGRGRGGGGGGCSLFAYPLNDAFNPVETCFATYFIGMKKSTSMCTCHVISLVELHHFSLEERGRQSTPPPPLKTAF